MVQTTCAIAQEAVAVPSLTARVTDLTATLSAEQKASLESRLAAIDAAGGAQITVLLLPTTQPESMEQFGIRTAEAWRIGHKGRDNGVIVIVAKADRRARIEVGYGLEGAIPDAIAKRIIAEQMTPRFKQGDFYGGIQATIEGLEMASRGEALDAQPATYAKTVHKVDIEGYGMAVMAAALVGGVVRKILGLFGVLIVSGLVGGAALLFGASWLIAVLLGIATFILSFFNLGGMAMGGGGHRGGGFGGGGGFSGGGGRFGGGGASGSW
ncbi:MAG: TPM domain-containing protein [Rhodocyclaceae bacterium]|nr:TPM domain-containing protein [Rhodocyclaceae bacterium]